MTTVTGPSSEPMPDWLKRSLVAKGVLSEQGLTRKAKVMHCRRCRQPVMAGFDAERAAMDAWCDFAELTAFGEAMALVEGRRTYSLTDGERPVLDHRDRWRIAGAPAGAEGSPVVLASHVCGARVPRAWERPRVPRQPPRPGAVDDDLADIPF